jgi:hypothetical protein
MRHPARMPQAASLGSSAAAKKFSLTDILTRGESLPNRYGLHAPPGFGKTSLLAYASKPVFMMTRGETGLTALIEADQLPPTPHFPEILSWGDLMAAVDFLIVEPHDFKTLVLDTANGAERLLHEYVCERDFQGDWGERGFGSYQKGFDVALADWRLLQDKLDDLRRKRGMTVFYLFHTRVKQFKNPNGADYDRYAPQMHDKTWAITQGWLDCVLFGNHEVTVMQGNREADPSKKGKAAELSHRIIYTNSNNPTYDAKNRLGLVDEIEMGDSAKDGWSNFATAVREAKKKNTATPEVVNG